MEQGFYLIFQSQVYFLLFEVCCMCNGIVVYIYPADAIEYLLMSGDETWAAKNSGIQWYSTLRNKE